MDELDFVFKAYSENNKIIIHIKMDDAEAIFRYTDPESIAKLAENMSNILEYVIDDYDLREKFKQQLEDDLDDWLKDLD
jgi:hypothetical protein